MDFFFLLDGAQLGQLILGEDVLGANSPITATEAVAVTTLVADSDTVTAAEALTTAASRLFSDAATLSRTETYSGSSFTAIADSNELASAETQTRITVMSLVDSVSLAATETRSLLGTATYAESHTVGSGEAFNQLGTDTLDTGVQELLGVSEALTGASYQSRTDADIIDAGEFLSVAQVLMSLADIEYASALEVADVVRTFMKHEGDDEGEFGTTSDVAVDSAVEQTDSNLLTALQSSVIASTNSFGDVGITQSESTLSADTTTVLEDADTVSCVEQFVTQDDDEASYADIASVSASEAMEATTTLVVTADYAVTSEDALLITFVSYELYDSTTITALSSLSETSEDTLDRVDSGTITSAEAWETQSEQALELSDTATILSVEVYTEASDDSATATDNVSLAVSETLSVVSDSAFVDNDAISEASAVDATSQLDFADAGSIVSDALAEIRETEAAILTDDDALTVDEAFAATTTTTVFDDLAALTGLGSLGPQGADLAAEDNVWLTAVDEYIFEYEDVTSIISDEALHIDALTELDDAIPLAGDSLATIFGLPLLADSGTLSGVGTLGIFGSLDEDDVAGLLLDDDIEVADVLALVADDYGALAVLESRTIQTGSIVSDDPIAIAPTVELHRIDTLPFLRTLRTMELNRIDVPEPFLRTAERREPLRYIRNIPVLVKIGRIND